MPFELIKVVCFVVWCITFRQQLFDASVGEVVSRVSLVIDHTDHWLLKIGTPCFNLYKSCNRQKKIMAWLKRTPISPQSCSETWNTVSVYDHCILRCQYYSVMRLLFLHESRHCSPTSCCDIKRCFLSRRHCISVYHWYLLVNDIPVNAFS